MSSGAILSIAFFRSCITPLSDSIVVNAAVEPAIKRCTSPSEKDVRETIFSIGPLISIISVELEVFTWILEVFIAIEYYFLYKKSVKFFNVKKIAYGYMVFKVFLAWFRKIIYLDKIYRLNI